MTWRAAAVAASLLLSVTACAYGVESPSSGFGAEGEAPRGPRPGGQRLILIVVDGLDARDVSNADTPALAQAWRESPWCPNAEGRAAMPARTNVSHATLLTGVHPEVHGIVGNAFWDRTGNPPRKLGAARDLLTETLFTVAQRTRPQLRTAVAVGKDKLALDVRRGGWTSGPAGALAPDASAGRRDATR